MIKKVHYIFYFLLIVVPALTVSCDKNEYFERPEWLEDPIYTVLKQDGRFNSYLQCVDRTLYADVLKGAGLYTVFAPNDSAFSLWMETYAYQEITDIPQKTINEIVAYSIVYGKWEQKNLSFLFNKNQYEPGAYKRKTALYSAPYKDPEYANKWVADETNRESVAYTSNDYQINLTLQNYKHLHIFTNEFFNTTSTRLSAKDYNTFYPRAEYTGWNVQEGSILEADIYAENGLIHVVSNVNMPLPNIETILANEAESSVFKSFFDMKSVLGDYKYKKYVNATDITPKLVETYKKMLPTEEIDQIYVKQYSKNFSFSPVMENIFSEEGVNVSEKSGNTLFVPDNDVLNDYVNNKLLRYYAHIDDLPSEVIMTLINTHMVKNPIWPSLYEESFNSTGEYLNGIGRRGNSFDDSGILDSRLASNGLYYRINHVIQSRYFETVFSEIYLNPDHLLLLKAYPLSLREELMKSSLNGYDSERWTVLNFSDNLLREDGYDYDDLNSTFIHEESADVSGGISSRLQRLINMHIFPGIVNSEIDSEIKDFNSLPYAANVYNGWGFLVNYNGDMIRFKDNKLQAAGNIEDGSFVTATLQNETYNNGIIYNVDGLLEYSPRQSKSGNEKYKDLTLWEYLDRARVENPNVSVFVNYVEKCLKKLESNELDGVKTEFFYTVIMPNNTAMANALNSGYIPPIEDLSGEDLDPEDLAQATKFVNAHFLVGQVIADDGFEFIYPVNPHEPNEAILTTLLKITNENLDLVNKQTQVSISKYKAGTNWMLRFEPKDIRRGNDVLVEGTVGTGTIEYINGVNRGKVNASATDNFRSNRIACKAVLHEVNNFIRFLETE